jgi:putative membrane protein
VKGLPAADAATAAALLAGAALYLLGLKRLRGRRGDWPARRTVLFLLGVAVVGAALLSPPFADDERFEVHALQHLLLGMAAPICLVLSAPLTLLLRALPPAGRAPLARLLQSRPARLLVHPATAAALAMGSLYALYFSPLYQATLRNAGLHGLVHLHFLLAGYLFTWSTVGIDPIRHRPAARVRGAFLLLAMAAHAVLAKLLYVHGPLLASPAAVSPGAPETAGLLLWYGGDAVDLVLLLLFFSQWYAAAGRALRRRSPLRPGPATLEASTSPPRRRWPPRPHRLVQDAAGSNDAISTRPR